MLGPLTLLLVLRISASSPSAFSGLDLFASEGLYSHLSYQPDVRIGSYVPFQNILLPPPRTSTTSSPFLAGVGLKYFLNQNDNFDDYDDYKEDEIKEENYVDYEEHIITVRPYDEDLGPLQPDDNVDDDEDDEPLQPDDEDEYYGDYDESTENNTVNSLNQNHNVSDQFDSDWVYNQTSWNQYYQNDWEYNQTYWDQYSLDDNNETDWKNNQSNWEYNRTAWDDVIPNNLSDWEEENKYTEIKPVSQFISAQYSSQGQVQVRQGQGYYLQTGQGQSVTSGRGRYAPIGQGQTVTSGQGQHVQSGQGQIVTSGQERYVPIGQGQNVTRGQGQHVQSGQGQIVTSGQGQHVQSGQGQIMTEGQGQYSQSRDAQLDIAQSNAREPMQGSIEGKGKKSSQHKVRNHPQSSKGQTIQEQNVPVINHPINSERPILYPILSFPGSQFNGIKVKEKTKVKKCCPLGQGYDITNRTCVVVSDSFNPPVWDGFYLIEEVNATQEFRFNIDFPSCSPGHNENLMQATNISQVLYVRWDGKLTVEFPRDRSPALSYSAQKYCMDNFVYKNSTAFDAFICYTQSKNYTHTTLSCVCMLVTCFLILLRVILFAWLPELRTLHGMILMAYLISFLVGFMLLAITQLLFELDVIVQDVCTFFSFIIYFSMLSAFFWRNIMCYDIWWTFSGKRAFSTRGFSFRTRFNLYSAYAFGVPIALTVLLGALEFSSLPSLHPLMPKLRIQGCFLYGNSKLLYLYGPIILLFIINVIFSTLTAVKIAAVKKETRNVLQSNESSTHDQQRATKRFSLYLKLFTAMAFLEVNWMLEVVAVFGPDITSLLHISDIYNVLVPLIIFINFMCQKQTWKMIKKRYRQVKGLPASGVPTSGTQATQSQDDSECQIKQV